MTFPRADRLLLMLLASLSRVPDVPARFCRSDPAKSTMWNRAYRERVMPSFVSWQHSNVQVFRACSDPQHVQAAATRTRASTIRVNTLWARDDSRFMAVLPTRRFRAPARITASASSAVATFSSSRPSTNTPCCRDSRMSAWLWVGHTDRHAESHAHTHTQTFTKTHDTQLSTTPVHTIPLSETHAVPPTWSPASRRWLRCKFPGTCNGTQTSGRRRLCVRCGRFRRRQTPAPEAAAHGGLPARLPRGRWGLRTAQHTNRDATKHVVTMAGGYTHAHTHGRAAVNHRCTHP